MFNDINNLPTLKEIETKLFEELQDVIQEVLISILTDLDEWLMNNRDFSRFKYREKQETTIATMFGPVTINRRRYRDEIADKRITLLDHYLEFDGSDSLSPFLTEMSVKWAIKGPSYRDSRDRFCDLLGYRETAHATIHKKIKS